MKNILLSTYSTNILVRLLTVNMKNCLSKKYKIVRPHSRDSIKNATPLIIVNPVVEIQTKPAAHPHSLL